jgi:predicted CXXCH cytochrome family protein
MRRYGPVVLLLILSTACDKGAPQYSGSTPADDPVAVYGECAYCHTGIAANLVDTGGHANLSIKCQACHDDLMPDDPGPGHATIPACADCHSEQQTHFDPAAGTAGECQVCHTPHGSPNLVLINTAIRTPEDTTAPIVFTNLEGLADGSFASASDPGTGICEVCHVDTLYYRSDGTGEPHFTFPCYTCHPHSGGFAPE